MMPDPMEHVQPRTNLETIGNFSITSPLAQTSPSDFHIFGQPKEHGGKVPPSRNREVEDEIRL
jgi:hypothetical protein